MSVLGSADIHPLSGSLSKDLLLTDVIYKGEPSQWATTCSQLGYVASMLPASGSLGRSGLLNAGPGVNLARRAAHPTDVGGELGKVGYAYLF
jgi:hypothetical protein